MQYVCVECDLEFYSPIPKGETCPNCEKKAIPYVETDFLLEMDDDLTAL